VLALFPFELESSHVLLRLPIAQSQVLRLLNAGEGSVTPLPAAAALLALHAGCRELHQ